MDGWVDGWMDGSNSRFKDCLQQSKTLPSLLFSQSHVYSLIKKFALQGCSICKMVDCSNEAD
jgi:hypothetical protein